MKIQRLAGSIVALSMIGLPIISIAETTTVNSSVQNMLVQIQALQTQIQALKDAQAKMQVAKNNLAGSLSLIRSLKQGMSGEDVRALQAILAADPGIYPEGTVSGFFGSLTAEAVKKFQKKHGFEQVGFVGPKTLRKLNQEFEKLGLSFEISSSTASSTTIIITNNGVRDDDKNDKKRERLCAKIPPGHLIAPGWLKKNDRPLIPECQKIPGGIDDKDRGNNSKGTTTPWLVTKASPSVSVGGIIFDKASLMFGNTPTGTITFQVFGPGDTTCSTPLSPALPQAPVNGNGIYISGNFTTATTGTYRFIATYSGDSKNNPVKNSCGELSESVNVSALLDNTAPQISSVTTSNLLSTTTNVTWNTNEESNSRVWFGTSTPVLTSGTANIINSNMLTNHNILVSGLSTSTLYYFVVSSSDSSGNTATSSQGSFTTTLGS